MTSTSIGVNKIATVIIPVSDQDRAIEFYVNLRGFKRVDVPFGNGYRWGGGRPGDHRCRRRRLGRRSGQFHWRPA